jgi:hypothetical protein
MEDNNFAVSFDSFEGIKLDKTHTQLLNMMFFQNMKMKSLNNDDTNVETNISSVNLNIDVDVTSKKSNYVDSNLFESMPDDSFSQKTSEPLNMQYNQESSDTSADTSADVWDRKRSDQYIEFIVKIIKTKEVVSKDYIREQFYIKFKHLLTENDKSKYKSSNDLLVWQKKLHDCIYNRLMLNKKVVFKDPFYISSELIKEKYEQGYKVKM